MKLRHVSTGWKTICCVGIMHVNSVDHAWVIKNIHSQMWWHLPRTGAVGGGWWRQEAQETKIIVSSKASLRHM